MKNLELLYGVRRYISIIKLHHLLIAHYAIIIDSSSTTQRAHYKTYVNLLPIIQHANHT